MLISRTVTVMLAFLSSIMMLDAGVVSGQE